MVKLLWIGRTFPAASTSGDRVYSRGLAQSTADAGAAITFIGLPDPEASASDRAALHPSIVWRRVPGRPNGTLKALASLLPLVGKRHATASFRREIGRALRGECYDIVVLDQYGTAWALDELDRAGIALPVVYIAHNDETQLAVQIHRDSADSIPRRLALKLNAWKIARAERRLLARASLVVTLTPEDADAFGRMGAADVDVIAPGHPGAGSGRVRTIDAETPRRVVLFGSFKWVAKQMNLKAFVAAADARFYEAGIVLDVVGEAPQVLREQLGALRATRLHGFVVDPAPILASARIGVVPELTGGGFKLKTLDYIFAGVPVAGLAEALAGLPDNVRANVLATDDLPGLVDLICRKIDDVEDLDRLQRGALQAADRVFSWPDNGVRFVDRLERLVARS